MTTLAPVAPPVVARRPAGAPHLVLTRRGRRLLRALSWSVATVVVAVAVVLLWLSVASAVAPGAVAGDGGEGVRSGAASGARVETTTVVVEPGDTLWQIARAHAPGRDPRSVTEQIVGLNDLTSAAVQVGDSLLVPTS